jgi:hypothetical protein
LVSFADRKRNFGLISPTTATTVRSLI